MKYGYARVSTATQNLEVQIQALQAEECEEIYSEKYTGTKTDRPQFQQLLKHLDKGEPLLSLNLIGLHVLLQGLLKPLRNCLTEV